MTDFRMPSLGADMEAGTLVEWLVKPGDRVRRGDVIAVVETQKGAIEIEVFSPGVVSELVVPVGTKLPVGTVMARLDTGAAGQPAPTAAPTPAVVAPAAVPPAAAAPAAPSPAVAAPAAPVAASPAVASPAAKPLVPAAPPAVVPVTPSTAAAPVGVALHVAASPAARRLAAERGIALGRLTGSGPDGAITLADVEAASAEAPVAGAPVAATASPQAALAAPRTSEAAPSGSAAAPAGSAAAPSGSAAAPAGSAAAPPGPAAPAARRAGFDPAAMRQAIAAAMSRSKREIPHYYLSQTVEVTAALARLERLNRDRAPPDRLLPAALLLRATALALAKTPELNGFWEDGKFRAGDGVHIGWATSLRGGGLIAPAIRDADQRSLDELMAAMRDVVRRARSGGVRSSELSDPTITITSLGERGAESVLPIINPPQVAMVGFGRIVTRPWVVDGAIGPRPVTTLTLAGDHRASDGHRGGLLLAEIDKLLQEAETL
jgi:pyruvate dehydrogenase E2 component (dihydrolipoamide acetyltransferase)